MPCTSVLWRSDGVTPRYFINHAKSQQNRCAQTAQTTNLNFTLLVSTMSASWSPNLSDVKRWFDDSSLPWDTLIKTYLFGLGLECVEHLKMLELIKINGMFQQHPPITHRISKRFFKDLKSSGKLYPKKCANELGVQKAAAPLSS